MLRYGPGCRRNFKDARMVIHVLFLRVENAGEVVLHAMMYLLQQHFS